MPTITGTPGDDTLSGTAGIDQINGLDGNDVFNGPFISADIIDGGEGTDSVYITNSGIPTLRNVEFLSLAGTTSDQFILDDATISSGHTLTIDASQLVKLPHMASFFLDAHAETDGNLIVYGGPGDDYISGGAGNDILNLGDGYNTVYAGTGDDVITGGKDLDLIYMGGNLTAADRIEGGGYTTASDVVYLNGDYSGIHAVAFSATTMVDIDELQLQGDFGYDLTFSDATIAAGRILFVGPDSSGTSHVVKLDASADTDGRVFLRGGANNDILRGGRGDDELTGYAGNDTLSGGAGKNTLYGGDGFDTAVFVGTRSDYTISYSEDGNVVRIIGNGEDSTLVDVESLQFSDQNLTITTPQIFVGTNGFDTLTGWNGNDILRGLDGGDWLIGGAGDDVLDGGGDLDWAAYDNNNDSIVANLVTGTVIGTLSGHDTLIDIEGIYTLAPNSTLVGNDSNNMLSAVASAHISAGGGNDTIQINGLGASIDGGEGYDSLTFNPNTNASTQVTFTPGANGALISGTMYNSVESMVLGTGSGDDTYTFHYLPILADQAAIRSNFWFGEGGNDTAIADMSSATAPVILADGVTSPQISVGNEVVIGFQNVENYWVTGGIGNDQLVGYSGDDVLAGSSGNDTLKGSGGNDHLRGGSGTNSLDGGSGTDTAAYARAPGSYIVTLNSDGSYTVKAPDFTDTLISIEQASFDGTGQTLSLGDFIAQSFNPLSYIASYSDLIRGAGDNANVGLQHYMQHGYYEGRTVSFSPLAYIASYSDLIRGAGDNQTIGVEHYILHGFYEGRTTSFNALQYIASYGDLIRGAGDSQTIGLEHYILHGFYEGRTATFNPLQYIASYGDLIRGAGDNQTIGLEHYILHGFYEGRTATFNPLQYIASYGDLIRGAGDNQTIGLEHYVLHGFYEGRTATFDAIQYIASYDDLIRGAGDNQTIGLEHYILHGFYEGRTANFDAAAYLLSNTALQNGQYDAQSAELQFVQTGFYQGKSRTGAFGSEQTQHILTLGTQASDSLTSGDKDWFSIDLTGGHAYDLSLSGSTPGALADPFLELRDAHGVLVAQDNDSGPGTDALIHLTAATTGTYYLVAASNIPGQTGNYNILANNG